MVAGAIESQRVNLGVAEKVANFFMQNGVVECPNWTFLLEELEARDAPKLGVESSLKKFVLKRK